MYDAYTMVFAAAVLTTVLFITLLVLALEAFSIETSCFRPTKSSPHIFSPALGKVSKLLASGAACCRAVWLTTVSHIGGSAFLKQLVAPDPTCFYDCLLRSRLRRGKNTHLDLDFDWTPQTPRETVIINEFAAILNELEDSVLPYLTANTLPDSVSELDRISQCIERHSKKDKRWQESQELAVPSSPAITDISVDSADTLCDSPRQTSAKPDDIGPGNVLHVLPHSLQIPLLLAEAVFDLSTTLSAQAIKTALALSTP
ncbi:hypothetical protein HDV03_000515 [Kappamyces sp. JEL0829]|nr:hypothetical protein HDV03_000515 [Kappamyces sp. JEL0829]